MVAKILISQDIEAKNTATGDYLSKAGLKINHPDLLFLKSGSKLGVEEAKQIREFLSIKPYQAKGRGVVIEDASVLTHEAQNALLKTLEELPEKTLFIMASANENNFLPTVLSRCEVISLTPSLYTSGVPGDNIQKLINSTLEERFAYIEKLKEKEQLLKDLVNYFHQNLTSRSKDVNTDFLKKLLEAEKWAALNVNIRAILEYLMIIMPSRKN